MVGTTEVLDALKSIGLNLYERKIFVALLAKGVATAAEVSEIAGVPRSRSYDVLESLADKGFVVVQPSKPIKYVALKPSEAMERVKDNIKKKHDEMIQRIDRLKNSNIFDELEKIYSRGLNLVQPSEITGTLKGDFVINRQLKSIFRDAQKNIKIITTEKGLEDLHQNHFRILKKIAKNGVKLQIVAPSKQNEAAKALSQIADIRATSAPVGKFAIVDDKHVFMNLTDDAVVDESQNVALWASSKHAAENIAGRLFEHMWKNAK